MLKRCQVRVNKNQGSKESRLFGIHYANSQSNSTDAKLTHLQVQIAVILFAKRTGQLWIGTNQSLLEFRTRCILK